MDASYVGQPGRATISAAGGIPQVVDSSQQPQVSSGASKNLRPHQWQIGEIVFGRATQYRVMGWHQNAYSVNAQDSQIPLSDKVTMGQDSRQPQTLVFKIGVVDNAPMRNMPNTLPPDLVTKASKLLGALQDEWYADDIKQQWGQYKPLIYCDGYGLTKLIWGRPRKFDYSSKTETSQWREVTAEFQRMDTLCYREIESLVDLVVGADPVFYSVGGDANSPFRVLLTGPMSDPTVTLGANQVQLDLNILADVVVEVNAYPWSQRVIDSNGISWRNKLIGQTHYLDQLILPKNTSIPMSWTADNTSPASKCQVLWRDTFNVI
ncbi:hypothetical protein [Mycobacterium malmoense]|uniref:hypothetical protein n=1 Tax=Mycobacterium malmoense TaxID=1780 RepID=UPI0008F8859A|nr:hypothetical protein [Mycobacterium malmoense]OIN79351.1 hypothetical protein BMG05_18370 [Mycobacterium malmoense]